MRVIAGSARGRPLAAPKGMDVRPTADRVRGAVFNSLTSLDALRDARVVDLFAGTGALGIEALSRGAAHCTFVDTASRSLECVRANLERTGLADRATVVRSDALAHVGSLHGPYDLALADPPYAFDGWPELLDRLHAAVLVAESDREVFTDGEPTRGWDVLRVRRYGGTVVTIAERAAMDGPAPA